ncbi:MAG TPA: DMT family transporter [Flavisolibacter sp.]|nr:DMT family transporter [Flavisolibacter sp.]
MSHEASDRNKLLQGIGFAILATILWSGNYIVARALHKSVPPVSIAFFRWTVATVILFPIAYQKVKAEWRQLKVHFGYLSITALAGVTLFNTLIYLGGRHTSATNLALIGTTAAPIFVLIITGLVLRQQVRLNQIAGAAICVLGILVLLSGGDLSRLEDLRFNRGDLFVTGAALSFACYTILVRRMPPGLSPLSFLFNIFFLGTLFLLPVFLLERAAGFHFEWNGTVLAVFAYLGIGASVMAFLLWNLSIKAIGSARTALFGNLIPVFSTIEAALILEEPFTTATGFSLGIILTGLIIANVPFRKRRAST